MSIVPTWRLADAPVEVKTWDKMKQRRQMLELHVSNFAQSDKGFQILKNYLDYFLNFQCQNSYRHDTLKFNLQNQLCLDDIQMISTTLTQVLVGICWFPWWKYIKADFNLPMSCSWKWNWERRTEVIHRYTVFPPWRKKRHKEPREHRY